MEKNEEMKLYLPTQYMQEAEQVLKCTKVLDTKSQVELELLLKGVKIGINIASKDSKK